MEKKNAITRLVKGCLEDDVLNNQKIATSLRRNIVYLQRIRQKNKKMKSSISTIKFLVVLSITLLIVTYGMSLNDENRWIVLDTPWLSNSFAFAIAGGSFASVLVVFACELQKYQSIKHQTEDYIFGQLFSLYAQVTIIHYNTKRQLNDVSSPIPSNIIDEIANKGRMCLTSLASIDYFTFCKHSIIKKQLIQYRGTSGTHIQLFLQNSVFLKMAINEDKITLLKQGRDELITSNMPKTHQTLKKIFDDSSSVLSFVEKSLGIIDTECKKRYHWDELKRSIISGEEVYVSASLDDYVRAPKIQFE